MFDVLRFFSLLVWVRSPSESCMLVDSDWDEIQRPAILDNVTLM